MRVRKIFRFPLPHEDPNFTTAPWKDAAILPPPEQWGGGLAGGHLPAKTLGFDPATGKPMIWPMRYSIVHWAALVNEMPVGEYDLRCRTIDANGIAQPLPRPLPKSGVNSIDSVSVTIKQG